jgi:hypothetical protein
VEALSRAWTASSFSPTSWFDSAISSSSVSARSTDWIVGGFSGDVSGGVAWA